MENLENSQNEESIQRKDSIFSKIKNRFGGKDSENNKIPNPSRRTFLRGVAGIGAAMVLNSVVASEGQNPPTNDESVQSQTPISEIPATEEIAEQEKNSVPLILDIFNAQSFYDKIIQEKYSNNGVDVEGIVEKFGITESWSLNDFKAVLPENKEESAILLLIALRNHYAPHGKDVDAARTNTSRFLNTPEVQAIHTGIEEMSALDSVEMDEFGNPTVWLRANPEVIDQLLAQSDETVVNMSFQMGKVGIKYKLYTEIKANPDVKYPNKRERKVGDNITITYFDGDNNEISKEKYDELLLQASEKKVVLAEDPSDRDLLIQDGYIKERAYDNLKLMAELAAKHPDKILMVAAGNPTDGLPDLRDARAKLSEEGLWPSNLFTIGFVVEQQGYMAPVEHGADFYVWYKDINLITDKNSASSYATPMVTEVVRHLHSLGLTEPEDIREALVSMSTDINTPEHKTYIEGNSDQPYLMIDFGKVKREFQKNTKEIKAE